MSGRQVFGMAAHYNGNAHHAHEVLDTHCLSMNQFHINGQKRVYEALQCCVDMFTPCGSCVIGHCDLS